MAFLKHVGLKPEMTDYAVANTGITGVGAETKEVPNDVVHKFLVHPDVWQLVKSLAGDPLDDAPPPAPAPAPPARGATTQFFQPDAAGEPWTIVDRNTPDSPVDLDVMDLRTLRGFAAEFGLDIDRALNTNLTRAAVLAAALAKPA